MLFRQFKFEVIRLNFHRFMLLSVVMAGSALLMVSLANFPKSTKTTDKRFYPSHFSTNNASDLSVESAEENRLKNTNRTSKDYTVEESRAKSLNWRLEDFPELGSDTILMSVFDHFHSKVRQRKRKRISSNNFQYVHNVPNACVERKVKLVIGVPSRINSLEARQAVRDTWGQYALNSANTAIVLFFLGVQADRAGQEHIDTEALKFGDIIQEDFEDTYRNLSLKSIAIIKWVSIYCPDSLFVLKADDDMYINVPRLVARLQKQMALGPIFMIGALHFNTSPFRDSKNKWYVTKAEYAEKYFPNYLSGTSYAMTTSAAMRLYIESFYVKILFLEDVYLTGILADQASVPRIADEDFTWVKHEASGCLFRDKISGHKITPEDIRKIHKELYDPNLRCK